MNLKSLLLAVGFGVLFVGCGKGLFKDLQLGSSSSTAPAVTYSITFDSNGATAGTAPTDSNLYTTGSSITMPGAGTLEKTYYAFLGWNTKADGTGTTYAENASFTMASQNTTLYAMWDAVSFYVATTGNDTTGDGTTAHPYATIAKGITMAAASTTTKAVRVAAGNYTVSSAFALESNMQLLGGYDSSWNRNISTNVSQIDINMSTTPVLCSNQTGDILFEGFTLARQNSSDVAGIYFSDCPRANIRANKIALGSSNGDSMGIMISGDYQGTIERNVIDVALQDPRYIEGIILLNITSGSNIKIFNNTFNTKTWPVNSNPFAIQLKSSTGTYSLVIRNNTFRSGVYSSYSAAVGETSANNSGTVNLTFDNNIVFGSPVGGGYGSIYAIYGGPNTVFNFVSVKNNNFFSVDKVLGSTQASIDYATVSDLETGLASAASGNISVEMVSAGYFTDATNKDWSLSATAPATITQGGLDGGALNWVFNVDLTGTTRTGNGATGWSMGAFEKN